MQDKPRRIIYIRLEQIGPLVRIIRHVTPREYRPGKSSIDRLIALCILDPNIELRQLDLTGLEWSAEIHQP